MQRFVARFFGTKPAQYFDRYSVMKQIITFIILFLMGIVAAYAQGVPSNVPTNGLVAYFGFNGDANDLSGNGNNGTLETDGTDVPQLTTDRFGNANSAYLFGGIDDANFIKVPNSRTLRFDSVMTISFWMLQYSAKGTNSEQCFYFTDMGLATDNTKFAIFSKGGTNSCGSGPGLSCVNKASGREQMIQLFNAQEGTGENDVFLNAFYKCYAWGEWIHCVVVCMNSTIKIYLNGSLASVRTVANEPISFSDANNKPLYIGGMMGKVTLSSSTTSIERDTIILPFSGKLDDIAIYNRALSDEEVRGLFNNYEDPKTAEASIRISNADVINPCGTTNGTIALTPKSLSGVTYKYGTNPDNLQSSNVVASGPGEVHYYIASSCRQWDTVITLICDCSEEDAAVVNYAQVCPGASGERGDSAEVQAKYDQETSSDWTAQGHWAHGRGESNYRFMAGTTPYYRAATGDYAYFCSNLQSNNTSVTFPKTTSVLLSPAITIPYDPASTPIKLTFKYYSCGFASSTSGNFFNTMRLQYAPSPDGPWNTIWEISGSGHGTWSEVTLSLSSYLSSGGEYYFRFVVEGEGYSAGMDDFLITADTRWRIPEEVTVGVDGDTVRTERIVTFAGACPVTEITYWWIMPRTRSDTTVYDPEGCTWNGTHYDEGGNYSVTGLTNANGCDSAAYLHLYTDINNSEDVYITVCDQYTWEANGKNYTTSTLDSVKCQRCNLLTGDSTTRLHLTINYSATRDTIVRSCETLFWHGRNIQSDTMITLQYTTQQQCDSSITLKYWRYYNDTTRIVDSICEGDFYPLLDKQLKASGEYAAGTTNLGGCDSTIYLKLKVKERPIIHVDYHYDCHKELYILWGSTDRGHFKWMSSPTDPSLAGHENDDTLYMSAQQNYLYTFYADIDEPMSCPTTQKMVLPAPTEIKARLNVMPTYLTMDNLNVIATDGSTLDMFRTWYVDGVEQLGNSRKLTYKAAPTADSVTVALSIGDGNCFDSAKVVLPLYRSAIYVPNVFIPTKLGEGDAFHMANNTFRAQGVGITDFEIHIYTRGGALVFHSTDINEGWDGFHDGKLCSQSVYTYIIRFKDQITPGNWQYRKGTVTLLH